MATGRFDDFESILNELELEKRFREGVDNSNSDMAKNLEEMEEYLRHLDDGIIQADDNEWKIRYDGQTALNVYLSDHKGWLEAELGELRWKCRSGAYPDAMNFNLDLLTELELVRLVKHMERVMNECYKALRESEMKIDEELKAFKHFDEMRRTFKIDMKVAKQTMEKMKLEEMMERRAAAGSPNIYSNSMVDWMDATALEDPDPPENSKKGKKKKGLLKDGRSTSKSGAEKGSQQKDDGSDGAHSEPELDETTTDNSGEKSTDAGEDTEKADEDKEKENKK